MLHYSGKEREPAWLRHVCVVYTIQLVVDSSSIPGLECCLSIHIKETCTGEEFWHSSVMLLTKYLSCQGMGPKLSRVTTHDNWSYYVKCFKHNLSKSVRRLSSWNFIYKEVFLHIIIWCVKI